MSLCGRIAEATPIRMGVHHRAIMRWITSHPMDEIDMPPRDADGCPGWAAKS